LSDCFIRLDSPFLQIHNPKRFGSVKSSARLIFQNRQNAEISIKIGGNLSKMTTIRQLAQNLGLSITTVSRALDDYMDVSASTRAKVRAAAEASGKNIVFKMFLVAEGGYGLYSVFLIELSSK